MERKLATMPERINEIYRYAIAIGKVSTKQEFAELVGINNVTLSRFLNGKTEPSKKTIQSINEAIGSPFNEAWLLTGEGEMMADGTSVNPNTQTSDIRLLITEMRESRIEKDKQIDRLLCIIENMQPK